MSNEQEPVVRVQAIVTGRVQRVGYRVTCAERASQLGLAGSVRNRSDGSVEAHFEGPASAVETMLAWCWVGPRNAAVANVEQTTEEVRAEVGFSVS